MAIFQVDHGGTVAPEPTFRYCQFMQGIIAGEIISWIVS